MNPITNQTKSYINRLRLDQSLIFDSLGIDVVSIRSRQLRSLHLLDRQLISTI